MVPIFRLCVMFTWCVLFPADLAQAKCVLVLAVTFKTHMRLKSAIFWEVTPMFWRNITTSFFSVKESLL
jgi:hypothetical protein